MPTIIYCSVQLFQMLHKKLTGTVSAVFSTASNAFVILIDDQNHPYVLTYVNNSTNKFNQGIIPNLKIGEHITAYGYFAKTKHFRFSG